MKAGVRKVVLISPHGFCAGVERAVQMAEILLKTGSGPVYCLKEIVHNRQIIDDLTSRGMVFVKDIRDVPSGATVLFSAHGIPPAIRDFARERKLHAVDATCPFVTKVHQEVKRYAGQGYSILLIGHHKHDEIIGVVGEAPGRVTVIADEEEARRVSVSDPGKVAVLTQTTLNVDEVAGVMKILHERFPALQTPPSDDICYATRNRQQAVRLFAKKADAIVVLGAENSSNSNRLIEVAHKEGCAAFLASTLEKLAALSLDDINVLGVTAGASTPEYFVKDAIEHLKTRGFSEIEELALIQEDMHFSVPAELRSRQ